MSRDAKDYAIEFGEYLARAATFYLDATNAEPGQDPDDQTIAEARSHLRSAIYEFRKRATRAKLPVAADV